MAAAVAFRPMPLIRIPEPFDHPECVFEVQHDGFRALAHVTGHHCGLVSRNGYTFKHWPRLGDKEGAFFEVACELFGQRRRPCNAGPITRRVLAC